MSTTRRPRPPEPVARKRTDVMVAFATRIPADLQAEVRAYCEEHGELITDFTTQAMRYLLDLRKAQP
jgi:hypothetical protein